jgi:CRP/FNR family transcriptional regulator, cyclic AMP receptor protein
MPFNTAVFQRIATLPLATYQAGETVLTAGTTTGRLLILRKGAVTVEKEGTEIAKVTEPGAVFGELSALLNQPHTADVRTLEISEFRVARAELLEQDPVVLLYVAAILAQRLNHANQAVIELKSEFKLHPWRYSTAIRRALDHLTPHVFGSFGGSPHSHLPVSQL